MNAALLPRFVRNKDWAGLGLAFLSGSLLALGFAPLRLWWLAWIALAPLYVALNSLSLTLSERRAGLDRAWGVGFSFGMGMFLVGMYWMTEVGFWAWPVLSAIQALPFAVFGAVYVWLRRPYPAWGRSLIFTALWTFLEWARTQGKYAFPWFPLAATQVDALPLLQILSVTGQWGLTFAIALSGGLLGEAWLARKSSGFWARWVAPAVALPLILGVFGAMRLSATGRGDKREGERLPTLNVALTQSGNAVPSDEQVKAYLDLSRSVAAKNSLQKTDVILWPEGVAPPDLKNNFTARQSITEFARASSVSLLIGSDAVDRRGWFTSALLIDRNGQITGRYDKIQLVPMGEFFLFRPLLRLVTDRYIPEEDKVPGETPGILAVRYGPNGAQTARVGTIICYESAFPNRVRATVRAGAQCIALITDDETFGTTAGPYQHADFSILRAIENGRSLIRAAHTGTSRLIDPTGRVRQSLPLMQRGVLTGGVLLHDDTTFYVRFGDWLVALCGAICLAAVFVRAPLASKSASGQSSHPD